MANVWVIVITDEFLVESWNEQRSVNNLVDSNCYRYHGCSVGICLGRWCLFAMMLICTRKSYLHFPEEEGKEVVILA